MTPAELESVVGRRLATLPDLKAPAGLLSKIMAGVDRMARRPWYRRTWLAWPPLCQAASAAAFVALVWVAGSVLDRLAGPETSALVGTTRILWRLVLEPNAFYLAVSACAMGVSSALYCAAISRMLWERSPER